MSNGIVAVGAGLAAYLTQIGKQFRAVYSDSFLAIAVGIRVSAIRVSAAVVAALTAGLCGILVGHDSGLNPTMGVQYLFLAVVVVIIGGTKSKHTRLVQSHLWVLSSCQGG